MRNFPIEERGGGGAHTLIFLRGPQRLSTALLVCGGTIGDHPLQVAAQKSVVGTHKKSFRRLDFHIYLKKLETLFSKA